MELEAAFGLDADDGVGEGPLWDDGKGAVATLLSL